MYFLSIPFILVIVIYNNIAVRDLLVNVFQYIYFEHFFEYDRDNYNV